jgi:8-oxo-dGTP pyrophosphatase MutT (NUDIX family)
MFSMAIAPEDINERSYGVVPIMIHDGVVQLFLIQHHSGAWLFPKGHAEQNETDIQAAERELFEETGLKIVRWLRSDPFVERYRFVRGKQSIYKEAKYFPAIVTGSVVLQTEEVLAGKWEEAITAASHVSFPEMKRLVRQLIDWLPTQVLGN